MTLAAVLKIAWRNLWRHTRRTILTALAFAVGVFLLIVFLGLGDGMHEKMIETGVRMGSGHIVVEPKGARQKVAANLVLTSDTAEAVRGVLGAERFAQEIKGTAPRLIVSGLLSSAANATGVQVIGAEPAHEEALSLLPARMVEGTYLVPEGRTPPVVVGRALADKLKVTLGSKVVLMTQAGSEIQSQLLRVRGIFDTGMDDVDSHLISVPLADLQALLSQPGALTEEAVFLHRAGDSARIRDGIAGELLARPVNVLTWREAMPQLDQFIVLDDAGNYIFNGVVLFMVALGVLNTVLMAVLERRREFGLLVALGMRPALISTMVAAEAMLLTALGTTVGLVAGLAMHRYFATFGLDISTVADASFSVAGVSVDTVVYSYLYPGRITWALLFIGVLGLSATLYPAVRAGRTEATEALQGF